MQNQNAAPFEPTHPDPEIADALRAAANTERLLIDAFSRLGSNNLESVPDNYDSWSAVEIMGHLLDMEIAYGYRLRLIIGEEAPRFDRFDEDALVIAQRWRARDLPVLLAAWGTLRRSHLTLISRLSEDLLARGGFHSAHGSVTARDVALALPLNDRSVLSRLGRLEERILRPLA